MSWAEGGSGGSAACANRPAVATHEQEREVRAPPSPIRPALGQRRDRARRGRPRAGRGGAAAVAPRRRLRSNATCRHDGPARPRHAAVSDRSPGTRLGLRAPCRSPARVARATNRSAPGPFRVTKRTSNEPLGPRDGCSTRDLRPVPLEDDRPADAVAVLVDLELHLDAAVLCAELQLRRRRAGARARDADVVVLGEGRGGEQQGCADHRRGHRTENRPHVSLLRLSVTVMTVPGRRSGPQWDLVLAARR